MEKTSGTKTPVGKFPPSKYKKVFETAHVDPADILSIHSRVCPRKEHHFTAQLSLDGISEAKSNNVSLDVYSAQLNDCSTHIPFALYQGM